MASPNRQVSRNRSSIQTRFTYRFLRALIKLNHRQSTSNSSSSSSPNNDSSDSKETYYKRYRNVKRAAYASMASAVGRKRAWSRAQLLKIRRQAHLHRKRSSSCSGALVRRRIITDAGNPSDQTTVVLRKLVPGGEVMDLCSLLDETAHYINCLTSQVQIMRNIADLLST